MKNDRLAMQERSEVLAILRARVAIVFERLPMFFLVRSSPSRMEHADAEAFYGRSRKTLQARTGR